MHNSVIFSKFSVVQSHHNPVAVYFHDATQFSHSRFSPAASATNTLVSVSMELPFRKTSKGRNLMGELFRSGFLLLRIIALMLIHMI